MRVRSGAGDARGRAVRGSAAADVLDRLPDGGQRRRCRGHRPGGVPALPPGHRRGGGDRVTQGLPVGDHDPAGDRPPAFGARASRAVRGDLAPRAGPDRPRVRCRAARGDGRLALDGVPRPAREPVAGRAGGLPAPRGVRVRVRRDRARDRQDRRQLPADRRARPSAGRREAATVRGIAEAARGAGPSVLRRGRRGRHGGPDRPAGRGRRRVRRRRGQGSGVPASHPRAGPCRPSAASAPRPEEPVWA